MAHTAHTNGEYDSYSACKRRVWLIQRTQHRTAAHAIRGSYTQRVHTKNGLLNPAHTAHMKKQRGSYSAYRRRTLIQGIQNNTMTDTAYTKETHGSYSVCNIGRRFVQYLGQHTQITHTRKTAHTNAYKNGTWLVQSTQTMNVVYAVPTKRPPLIQHILKWKVAHTQQIK